MKTASDHFYIIERTCFDEWSVPLWELEEALEEMRRVAERATAQKAAEVPGHHGYVCPECGNRIRKKDDFCPRCGQKIDWEG